MVWYTSCSLYLFRTEGKQELMVLAGAQKACWGTNVENIICGQMGLDMGGLQGFPWKQRMQVGLHNLPVERQLQVASPQETEKAINNVIFNGA